MSIVNYWENDRGWLAFWRFGAVLGLDLRGNFYGLFRAFYWTIRVLIRIY